MTTHSRHSKSRLAKRLADRLVLFAVVAAVLPVAAFAQPQVYHSPGDDGLPAPGHPNLADGGVQSVYLYIDGGPTASGAGEACDTGQGDEVCGFEVVLNGLAGLTLSNFNPDGAANLVVNFGASSMTINGLDTVAPAPGPHRLGELQVNTAASGVLALMSGESVGADLSDGPITMTAVATVPEPGHWVLLGSGIAMLAALYRGRKSR